jgi:hypothetical protein
VASTALVLLEVWATVMEVLYHLEGSMVVLCHLEVYTEVLFHLENFTLAPAPLVDFTEVLGVWEPVPVH